MKDAEHIQPRLHRRRASADACMDRHQACDLSWQQLGLPPAVAPKFLMVMAFRRSRLGRDVYVHAVSVPLVATTC